MQLIYISVFSCLFIQYERRISLFELYIFSISKIDLTIKWGSSKICKNSKFLVSFASRVMQKNVISLLTGNREEIFYKRSKSGKFQISRLVIKIR